MHKQSRPARGGPPRPPRPPRHGGNWGRDDDDDDNEKKDPAPAKKSGMREWKEFLAIPCAYVVMLFFSFGLMVKVGGPSWLPQVHEQFVAWTNSRRPFSP